AVGDLRAEEGYRLTPGIEQADIDDPVAAPVDLERHAAPAARDDGDGEILPLRALPDAQIVESERLDLERQAHIERAAQGAQLLRLRLAVDQEVGRGGEDALLRRQHEADRRRPFWLRRRRLRRLGLAGSGR